MKFIYEYRSSDNVRHGGQISAKDRNDAFLRLRNCGIRPAHVYEAPGLLNKVLGRWKRWIVITVLSIVVLILCVSILLDRGAPYADFMSRAIPIHRRQVWGDRAVIEQAAKDGWRCVFSNPAERVLAMYAEPGRSVQSVPYSESLSRDFSLALQTTLKIQADDFVEYKQIKCIVEGMKAEMRAYLHDGGSIGGYLRRLSRRQNEELKFLQYAEERVRSAPSRNEDVLGCWSQMNLKLREQGLPALEMPE